MPTIAAPASAEQVYNEVVKVLPAEERLKLVSIIMRETPHPEVDDSEEWSDEDLLDFRAASWAYIDARLGDEAAEDEEDDNDAATR